MSDNSIEILVGISERTIKSLQQMYSLLETHLNETNRIESVINKISETSRDMEKCLSSLNINDIDKQFISSKGEHSAHSTAIASLKKHMEKVEEIINEIKNQFPELRGNMQSIITKFNEMETTNKALVRSNEMVIKVVTVVGSIITLTTVLLKAI